MGCTIKIGNQFVPETDFLNHLNKIISINKLFEENPDFSSQIYEALGFKQGLTFVESDNTRDDNIFIKDQLPIKYLKEASTTNYDGSTNTRIEKLKNKYFDKWTGEPLTNLQVIDISEITKPEDTSLEEILSKIKLSEANQILLEKIKPLVKGIKIQYINQFFRSDTAALYSDRYNTIRINNSEKGISLEEKIMHELLHAATFRKITYFETNTKGLSKKELEALNELENIRKVLKEASDKYWDNRPRFARSVNPLEGYRTDSIHEIISYAFTNEEFRKAIADIPYKGNKSILDKLIELIANIFGVKQDTVLYVLLANAEVLLENNQITPQQKQQATFIFSEFLDVYLQDFEQVEKILKEENIIEKDCTGGGKLKAEKGLQTSFTKNGKWKIIKDLKGYPTHKEGGVDLTIGKNGVSIKNGNTEFTAKHGLLIPKN